MKLERNLSGKVADYLEMFPMVVLLGPRQCGKTTLSRMVRPDWSCFDLENGDDFDLITRDYSFFSMNIRIRQSLMRRRFPRFCSKSCAGSLTAIAI